MSVDEESQQDSSQKNAATDSSTLLGSRQQLEDTTVHQWIVDDIPSGVDVGGFVVVNQGKVAVLYMKSSGVLAGKP